MPKYKGGSHVSYGRQQPVRVWCKGIAIRATRVPGAAVFGEWVSFTACGLASLQLFTYGASYGASKQRIASRCTVYSVGILPTYFLLLARGTLCCSPPGALPPPVLLPGREPQRRLRHAGLAPRRGYNEKSWGRRCGTNLSPSGEPVTSCKWRRVVRRPCMTPDGVLHLCTTMLHANAIFAFESAR